MPGDRPMTLLRAWWRDSVNYHWLVRTLEHRAALGLIRAVIATGCAVMGVISLLTLLSSVGPDSLGGRVIFGFIVGFDALGAVRWWLRPWPNVTESLTIFLSGDVLTTLACLVIGDRVYGATTSLLLVVIGGYLTFFHSPRVLALHVGWSLLSALVLTARMLAQDPRHGLAMAVAIVLIMMATNVVVLPALQFLYWLLRVETFSDPLTNLLNRRGLDYYLSNSLLSRGDHGLCLMIVDLDRFKAVNDTFGHHAGDQVLIQIADQLRAAVVPGSIVARTGGEEFVIVSPLIGADAIAAAEQLRLAVAATPHLPIPVTASVGVVQCGGDPAHRSPEYLLRHADSAMYTAKRHGRNRIAVVDHAQ